MTKKIHECEDCTHSPPPSPWRCPDCKHANEPIVTARYYVYPDGMLHHDPGPYWDEDSEAACDECGYEATLKEFEVKTSGGGA